MRMDTQFGVMGLVALLTGSTLVPSTVFGQTDPTPPAPGAGSEQDATKLPSVFPSIQQLQEQCQSALMAIEDLRLQTESNMNLHAARLVTQLVGMNQDFVSQHNSDMMTIRRANTQTLTIVLLVVGMLAMGVIFIALVPLRMMNQLAARVAATPPGPDPRGVIEAYQAAFTPLEQSSAKLQSTVLSLEKRLRELEHRSVQTEPPPAKAEVSPKKAAGVAASSHAASKSSHPPRIALTTGHGEALSFLPQDVRVMKLRSYLTLLQRIRKALRLAPQPKAGHMKSG